MREKDDSFFCSYFAAGCDGSYEIRYVTVCFTTGVTSHESLTTWRLTHAREDEWIFLPRKLIPRLLSVTYLTDICPTIQSFLFPGCIERKLTYFLDTLPHVTMNIEEIFPRHLRAFSTRQSLGRVQRPHFPFLIGDREGIPLQSCRYGHLHTSCNLMILAALP